LGLEPPAPALLLPALLLLGDCIGNAYGVVVVAYGYILNGGGMFGILNGGALNWCNGLRICGLLLLLLNGTPIMYGLLSLECVPLSVGVPVACEVC